MSDICIWNNWQKLTCHQYLTWCPSKKHQGNSQNWCQCPSLRFGFAVPWLRLVCSPEMHCTILLCFFKWNIFVHYICVDFSSAGLLATFSWYRYNPVTQKVKIQYWCCRPILTSWLLSCTNNWWYGDKVYNISVLSSMFHVWWSWSNAEKNLKF